MCLVRLVSCTTKLRKPAARYETSTISEKTLASEGDKRDHGLSSTFVILVWTQTGGRLAVKPGCFALAPAWGLLQAT